MTFDRTGIILYTIKYIECIHFYKNILGLKLLFNSEKLTCFKFGNSYLMVEKDDEYIKKASNSERIRTCLRMNVTDVKTLSNNLIKKGIHVNYKEYSWGTIAKFFDPDGNLCAFKDSEKFEQQIKQHN